MAGELAVSATKFVQVLETPNIQKAMKSYLGADKNVQRLMGAIRTCFINTPKLKQCTQESLISVIMKCTELGLYPSSVSGEAYILPYKDTATFQLGYQGMIALAYRAGVKQLDAQVVYDKDLFESKYGTGQFLKHVPDKFADDRGDLKGAYAIATLDNGIQVFEILSKKDIFKHRDKSQSWTEKGKKYSPWNPDNDPQLIMWRKTAIRQLFKFLPKSPVMQEAINADTKGDIIDIEVQKEGEMSTEEITAYYESLLRAFQADEIHEMIIKVRGTETLDNLTKDEAIKIQDNLQLKAAEKAANKPKAPAGSQETMI